MDSKDNTENECSDGAKLPPFAAIVKDAISECLLIVFSTPGRSLTAAFSAMLTTLLKHGSMVYQRMVLAEATVKCARENLITFSQ